MGASPVVCVVVLLLAVALASQSMFPFTGLSSWQIAQFDPVHSVILGIGTPTNAPSDELWVWGLSAKKGVTVPLIQLNWASSSDPWRTDDDLRLLDVVSVCGPTQWGSGGFVRRATRTSRVWRHALCSSLLSLLALGAHQTATFQVDITC